MQTGGPSTRQISRHISSALRRCESCPAVSRGQNSCSSLSCTLCCMPLLKNISDFRGLRGRGVHLTHNDPNVSRAPDSVGHSMGHSAPSVSPVCSYSRGHEAHNSFIRSRRLVSDCRACLICWKHTLVTSLRLLTAAFTPSVHSRLSSHIKPESLCARISVCQNLCVIALRSGSSFRWESC
jgi:hypothetical protein